MAAIGHNSLKQTTRQTTTSATYGNVSGCQFPSTDFTAGKKYLLVVTGQADRNSTGTNVGLRVAHGGAAFADSEQINQFSGGTFRYPYAWFHVWTAVASEAIDLQIASSDGATQAGVDAVVMSWMNLSDDLVENTDWKFGESSSDLGLTTTPQAGATVTITPGGASDWAVMSYAQYSTTAITTSGISRINRSGEASATLPECRREMRATSEIPGYVLGRVYALTAAANTFTEESSITAGTAWTRLHSKVFILNLNKFRNHAFAYTEADAATSATNYATLAQSVGITPDIAGDVWFGVYVGFDKANAARELEIITQLDNADDPAGTTTENYQMLADGDSTDEAPVFLQTVTNVTAAAHTLDVDCSTESTAGTPAVQYRTAWAVTMELAVPPTPESVHWPIYRTRMREWT